MACWLRVKKLTAISTVIIEDFCKADRWTAESRTSLPEADSNPLERLQHQFRTKITNQLALGHPGISTHPRNSSDSQALGLLKIFIISSRHFRIKQTLKTKQNHQLTASFQLDFSRCRELHFMRLLLQHRLKVHSKFILHATNKMCLTSNSSN